MLEKTQGAIKMDNLEILLTLDTQDTGRRQTKHITQKTKNEQHEPKQKLGLNTWAR
jgi:hypothetical protein